MTAPAELREQLRGLSITALIDTCARMRPGMHGAELASHDAAGTVVLAATKNALRHLARRHQQLNQEIADLDADLTPLVHAAAPRSPASP